VHISNSIITCPDSGVLAQIWLTDIRDTVFIFVNSTVEVEVSPEDVSFAIFMLSVSNGNMSSVSIELLHSQLNVRVVLCALSTCYGSPSVSGITLYGRNAYFYDVNISVIDTSATFHAIKNDSVQLNIAVACVRGTSSAGSLVHVHNSSFVFLNSTANLAAYEAFLMYFVKCEVVSHVRVVVQNVSLLCDVQFAQALSTRRVAMIGSTIGGTTTALSIAIRNATFNVTTELTPLSVLFVNTIIAMVALSSPAYGEVDIGVFESLAIGSIVNVPLTNKTPSGFAFPGLRFGMVSLAAPSSLSSELRRGTIEIDQCSLTYRADTLTSDTFSNTFMMLQLSLFTSDIPFVELLHVIVSASALTSAVGNTIGFLSSSSADVLVGFVMLNDPQMILFGRFSSAWNKYVDVLPASQKGSLTAFSISTVTITNSNIGTSSASSSSSPALFRWTASVFLPSNASAVNVTVENVALSSLLLPTSVVLCAMGCTVGNASNMTLISTKSRLAGVVSVSTTLSTAAPILVLTNSSLVILGVSTSGASFPILNTSSQAVAAAELRGTSVISMDGCSFESIIAVFDDNVLWLQNEHITSHAAVLLGCNSFSVSETSGHLPLLPSSVFKNTSAAPIVAYRGDTRQVTSPYLPLFVCPALHANETASPLSPVQIKPTTPAAVASSVFVVTVVALQALLPIGGVGGTVLHSIQASLLIRRKRLLCAALTLQGGNVSNDDTDSMCCDIATSPTQMRIGDDGLLSSLVGVVVGNVIVVTGLSLVKLGAARMSRRLPPFLRQFFSHQRGVIGPLWAPYIALTSPTVSAAVALLVLPQTSAGLIALGVLIGSLCCTPLVFSAYQLCGRKMQFPFRGLAPKGRLQRTVIQRLLRPSEELSAKNAASRPYARELLLAYAPVFEAYIVRCYWYFNVEVALLLANGVVMGLAYNEAERRPCSVWSDWLLFALGIVELTLALFIRPFAVPLDLVGLVTVLGLSALSQLLILVSPDDDPTSNAASDAVALASSVINLFLAAYGVVSVLRLGTPRWVRWMVSLPEFDMLSSGASGFFDNVSRQTPAKDMLLALTSRTATKRLPESAQQQHQLLSSLERSPPQEALNMMIRLITDKVPGGGARSQEPTIASR
jgi:hypothetical protein